MASSSATSFCDGIIFRAALHTCVPELFDKDDETQNHKIEQLLVSAFQQRGSNKVNSAEQVSSLFRQQITDDDEKEIDPEVIEKLFLNKSKLEDEGWNRQFFNVFSNNDASALRTFLFNDENEEIEKRSKLCSSIVLNNNNN